jgi:hypothetical protein
VLPRSVQTKAEEIIPELYSLYINGKATETLKHEQSSRKLEAHCLQMISVWRHDAMDLESHL